MVAGKKVTKESILPSVCEDEGNEGGKEEDLGGIASRPVSRPRSLYSRGSVDGQVSVPLRFYAVSYVLEKCMIKLSQWAQQQIIFPHLLNQSDFRGSNRVCLMVG